ncbi:hypothetical protein [Neochlamydia sp. AcF95]|uniref:hypothetical protein n=1 Tax=Neochlamydia sp. AcF95 TaxID=2795734 RepID=UPI001BC9C585|nr:hypothetical protein [Neochlamydia sp. AcF95]
MMSSAVSTPQNAYQSQIFAKNFYKEKLLYPSTNKHTITYTHKEIKSLSLLLTNDSQDDNKKMGKIIKSVASLAECIIHILIQQAEESKQTALYYQFQLAINKEISTLVTIYSLLEARKVNPRALALMHVINTLMQSLFFNEQIKNSWNTLLGNKKNSCRSSLNSSSTKQEPAASMPLTKVKASSSAGTFEGPFINNEYAIYAHPKVCIDTADLEFSDDNEKDEKKMRNIQTAVAAIAISILCFDDYQKSHAQEGKMIAKIATLLNKELAWLAVIYGLLDRQENHSLLIEQKVQAMKDVVETTIASLSTIEYVNKWWKAYLEKSNSTV